MEIEIYDELEQFDFFKKRNILYKYFNFVNFPSSVGMDPCKLFLERSLFNKFSYIKY